jgi:hemolysin III
VSDLAIDRPRLRGAVHARALPFVIPAMGILIIESPPGAMRVATAAYAAGTIGLLAVSTAYHRGSWDTEARRRWKAADHVMIFVAIFANWCPLSVATLSPRAATEFLGLLGLACAAGATLKVRRLTYPGGAVDVLYAATTWAGVLLLPAWVHILSPLQLTLLMAGLAGYALVGLTMITNSPNPVPGVYGFHEVAHTIGLVATSCHFVLYLTLIGLL